MKSHKSGSLAFRALAIIVGRLIGWLYESCRFVFWGEQRFYLISRFDFVSQAKRVIYKFLRVKRSLRPHIRYTRAGPETPRINEETDRQHTFETIKSVKLPLFAIERFCLCFVGIIHIYCPILGKCCDINEM